MSGSFRVSGGISAPYASSISSPTRGVPQAIPSCNASPAAAKVWADADTALRPSLGFTFTDLVWGGDIAELTKTENAQPAVIANALAIHAALIETGRYDNPGWHTGNSVGFIVSLVTSGALDTAGAVQLAEARGEAFKHAIDNGPKTTMMAVQNDRPEIVDQIIESLQARFPLSVCLLNTYNQVVLGGKERDIQDAAAYLQQTDPKLGQQLRILPVNAAFHSEAIAPAIEMYTEAVDKIDFKVPTNGILIAGSTVRPLVTVAEIKDALVRQLTQTERWRDVMKFLKNQGVVAMTELNSAPTLSDMNRRLFSGSKREKIVHPTTTAANGNPITIAWKWQAAVTEAPVETEVVAMQSNTAETIQAAEAAEVLALTELYSTITDNEVFLEVPAPKTYGGVELWYRKWTALRADKPIEDIDPNGDFVDDAEIDSLDYTVLRADVQGTFGRLVPEDQARDNITPRLAAQATYKLLIENN